MAGLAGSLLLLIVAFLFHESWPAIRQIGLLRFFSDLDWFPTENSYRMTAMILGTLWATAGAVLLAGPLGILSALFCQYYAPPMVSRWFRRMIELLAGIPSVVFGLWGLVILVPMIGRWHPPGPSLLAGILILSLMILPTIMLVAQASMVQVPLTYLHAATALGLTRWTVIRHIILPTAKTGLLTGVLLGVARALGETMAILMVCGNVVQIPSHLFDPIRTLTANMALEMGYALGHHRSALFVSGLLLMGLVALCVGMAESIRHNTTHATTT
ncbi:MAG: phosphate ABC transporter permease subunit PstC [Nitrospirales bacterium]